MTAAELKLRVRNGHREQYPLGCHDPACRECRCQYTPGPWEPYAPVDAAFPLVRTAKGEKIANVWKAEKPWAEAEANATLIAAAPDLLAALNDALRLIDLQGQPRIREVMMKAVAKAEGR